MSQALSIRKLCKSYERNASYSVSGVSFDVAPGEIVALLGPSGCGKTTTLRCIAGLEQPTRGSIRVGDRVFSSAEDGVFIEPQERKLGMVFQSYAVWPHMDVAGNVGYPLRRAGLDAATRKAKVAQALALVGLSDYGSRAVNTLSGGQLQRVALARSVVYEPALLLLDEPLSNLDAELRVRLRDDLRSIIKRVGLTAIFVTHDQSEAIGIADRIAVMRDGKLLQIDTPVNLYNRPADAFVAQFTGASNCLAATLVSGSGQTGIALIAGQPVAVHAAEVLQAGQGVDIVLRPENLQLHPVQSAGGAIALPATVRSRHYQGDHTSYLVGLSDGATLKVTEAGSAPRFAADDAVCVALPQGGGWALPAGSWRPAVAAP